MSGTYKDIWKMLITFGKNVNPKGNDIDYMLTRSYEITILFTA